MVPALGLAAMCVVMVQGPWQQAVSIESLLLADEREPAVLQHILTGERPGTDDLFGLLMEDAS